MVAIGHRVFYYDEAWFGYWVVQFLEHGAWEYRPILHGPFFARVNSIVFPLLGTSDTTGRLVVALIGGLLPLSAWLFRERLGDREVFALALVLAANPILLYYSRFMRKDLPLAAFMLVTLGLLVRFADTDRPRYLYASGITLGVAFGTKESVLLWVVAWLGAGVLVADQRLLRAHHEGRDVVAVLRDAGRRTAGGLRRWGGHAAIAGLLYLATIVYFYAPRHGPGQDIGLWYALGGEFGQLPAVIEAATVGSFWKAIDYWAAGSIQQHPYLPYFTDTITTLAAGAVAVCVLAVCGFLVDRYAGGPQRDFVAFNLYVGGAAIVGYPLANNLPVPWSTTHAIVPLAVPAAVGAGALYAWGRGHLETVGADGTDDSNPSGLAADWAGATRRLPVSERSVRVAIVVVIFAALVVPMLGTAYETSYRAPHESPRGPDGGNEIVYYAQAPGELRSVATAIERAAATDGADTDVLYVGDPLAMNESAVELPPATGAWHARMPLPWYTAAAGADVESTPDPARIGADPPPVVISTPAANSSVASRLVGYDSWHQPLDDIGDRAVVVFVRNGTVPAG